MGLYMKKILAGLLLLGMFAFCGCSYFDYADDESDYAPGVHDVVGCWLSTENLNVDVKVDKTTMYKIDYQHFDVTPAQTCMEFCVRADSSFTYVARITGVDVLPNVSTDINGTVDPLPVYIAGTGGFEWIFDWSQGNGNGLDDKKSLPILLIDGKLSGVGLLLFHSNRNLDFHNELSRKYSRTKDENACNAVSAK
jgi:hypothetical protein